MNSTSVPCSYIVDDSFGPAVIACRGGFDFTLLFEQSILTIGPAALFLLLSPFRLWQLVKEERKISTQWMLWVKQVGGKMECSHVYAKLNLIYCSRPSYC